MMRGMEGGWEGERVRQAGSEREKWDEGSGEARKDRHEWAVSLLTIFTAPGMRVSTSLPAYQPTSASAHQNTSVPVCARPPSPQ